jgi:glycosyltransferase involved in cell wall biosynthesis
MAGLYVVRPVPSPLHMGNAAWSPRLIHWLADFDLIHLHYPYIGGAEVVVRAVVRRDIPLVVTYHNRLYTPEIGRRAAFALYTRLIEPKILGVATQLIAVTEGSRQEWLARYRRVAVVGHGIDPTRFHPVDRCQARAKLGLAPGDAVILFVGALDRAHRFKNVDGLLTAASRLTFFARVVLLGTGDRGKALEELAKCLGIADRVIFLGERPLGDLASVYSAADVSVLPSLGAESFGLVLAESLACGTPVIASDLPGTREVLSGGGGWLVPPGDLRALTRTLEKVLTMRASERQAVANQGRTSVLERFTWPKVAESLEMLYQTALDRHRASASLASQAVVETSATKA